jgi:GTPase
MLDDAPIFRAGYVAVIGRPNVGKSTFINGLLGQKIAAVSPRPQTTRRRQLGILSLDQAQVVFVDTPGIHTPHHKLGEYMNEVAEQALEDADLILWLVDASALPTEEDWMISKRLAGLKHHPPIVLGLNKIDQMNPDSFDARVATYLELAPKARIQLFSAVSGAGRDELLQAIVAALPQGEPFFAEDEVTDLYEKEIALDLIREAALNLLQEEVPHCVAVRIDEYTDRSEDLAYIAATLFVERESQKGIVIGKGGEMIKKISSAARQSIVQMSGRQVFLELRVKVSANWRNNPGELQRLGYAKPKET